MDWIQFFTSDIKIEADRKFGFNDPASESLLSELKKEFNLTQLPPELEQLYRQTNGVDELLFIEQLNETILTGEFIWAIERVIKTNRFARTSPDYKRIYKSFDNLFFFADSGGGDHFGFETVNGQFERTDVFFWDHENDKREWVAPSMKAFTEGWFSGAIKI